MQLYNTLVRVCCHEPNSEDGMSPKSPNEHGELPSNTLNEKEATEVGFRSDDPNFHLGQFSFLAPLSVTCPFVHLAFTVPAFETTLSQCWLI